VLNQEKNTYLAEQWNAKPLTEKLFDDTDYRSMMATLERNAGVDSTNTSFTTQLANAFKMVGALPVAGLGAIFGGTSQPASALQTYNYNTSEVAIDPDAANWMNDIDENDSEFKSVYYNAAIVLGLVNGEGNNGVDYNYLAKQCFGKHINPADGAVTNDSPVTTPGINTMTLAYLQGQEYKNAGCSEKQDPGSKNYDKNFVRMAHYVGLDYKQVLTNAYMYGDQTDPKLQEFCSELGICPEGSASDALADATAAAAGTCPAGTDVVVGVTKGWDKNSGEEKNMTLCSVPDTKMNVISAWKDFRYAGTSSIGVDKLAVNSEAAQALLDATKRAKQDGVTLSGSIAYRSVFEQCSFFKGNGNKPTANQQKYYDKYCAPNDSWLKYPGGDWTTSVVVSNHMMGKSIDFYSASEKWMRKCMNENLDGTADGRCYGFYDDVYQKEHWDSAHFTYAPP
jgi:hypothetical protein